MKTLRTVALLLVTALCGGNKLVQAVQTGDERSVVGAVLAPVCEVAGLWGVEGLAGVQIVVRLVVA